MHLRAEKAVEFIDIIKSRSLFSVDAIGVAGTDKSKNAEQSPNKFVNTKRIWELLAILLDRNLDPGGLCNFVTSFTLPDKFLLWIIYRCFRLSNMYLLCSN